VHWRQGHVKPVSQHNNNQRTTTRKRMNHSVAARAVERQHLSLMKQQQSIESPGVSGSTTGKLASFPETVLSLDSFPWYNDGKLV
jgi:hypothetical protein